jgi:hypothetical protein
VRSPRLFLLKGGKNLDQENRADVRKKQKIEQRRLVDVEHFDERFVEQNNRAHGPHPSGRERICVAAMAEHCGEIWDEGAGFQLMHRPAHRHGGGRYGGAKLVRARNSRRHRSRSRIAQIRDAVNEALAR